MRQKLDSKIKMAVMFGGRSAEHEISIITGLQAIQAIDPCRYEIIPVYIAPTGKWYSGEGLLDKSFYRPSRDHSSQKVEEVTLLPDPSIQGLTILGKTKPTSIPIDVCFLAFHGQFVEDGCLQGLLELADIPYTGCNVKASSVAMDKYQCKMFYRAHGIPVLPAAVVTKCQALSSFKQLIEQVISQEGLKSFPLFVKPNALGSSVGISLARNSIELERALAKAFRFDDCAIVEPYLSNIMEVNVSVLDGYPPIASVVEIPIPKEGGVLTFEDKYLRGSKKTTGHHLGMASLSRIIDPSHLDKSIQKQIVDFALKGFSLLRCSGVVRFDFMIDQTNGSIYFNELNTIPGSLAFYLWEKTKPRLLYTELVDKMVERALKRKEEQLSLQRNLGFKALG